MDSANSDPERGDTRRRPGRPRKDFKKTRDTRTVRLALGLLQRVEEHKRQQRAGFGYGMSISELLTNAWDVFLEYSQNQDLGVLMALIPTRERRLIKTIVDFLTTRRKTARRDVVKLLEATNALINLSSSRKKKKKKN
jgi:hypothetical protein